MLCSFMFSLCIKPRDVTFTPLMFYTLSSWSCSIFIFIAQLFCLSHSPGPCPLLSPLVRESLIWALVAVQMALCWCFTMGLRSMCLMPRTHTKLLHSSCPMALFVVYLHRYSINRHHCSCVNTYLCTGLRGSCKTTDTMQRQPGHFKL